MSLIKQLLGSGSSHVPQPGHLLKQMLKWLPFCQNQSLASVFTVNPDAASPVPSSALAWVCSCGSFLVPGQDVNREDAGAEELPWPLCAPRNRQTRTPGCFPSPWHRLRHRVLMLKSNVKKLNTSYWAVESSCWEEDDPIPSSEEGCQPAACWKEMAWQTSPHTEPAGGLQWPPGSCCPSPTWADSFSRCPLPERSHTAPLTSCVNCVSLQPTG